MKEKTEKQVIPVPHQDYFEKLIEEFEEDGDNELQFQEEIECEDNVKEGDCSVNLESEEEYNSDIDINSTEIDELMTMINS